MAYLRFTSEEFLLLTYSIFNFPSSSPSDATFYKTKSQVDTSAIHEHQKGRIFSYLLKIIMTSHHHHHDICTHKPSETLI